MAMNGSFAVSHLTLRGWVAWHDIAVTNGWLWQHPRNKGPEVDTQKALAIQAAWEIGDRAAVPLYHWGKDFAVGIDLRRASQ